MKGYLNDEKATKEVSRPKSSSTYYKVLSCDGWLTTGDVGYVDEEGYVYIVDREKDVIRYKGSVPISPSELERIIQQHPAVCDVVVVPSYNAQKEEVKKKKVSLTSRYQRLLWCCQMMYWTRKRPLKSLIS